MGCSSCGTSNGKPGGCRSNGGCSSGGCNRLNVHDWLANLPFHDPEASCRIVEVSFNQGSRKEFYRNGLLQVLSKGDLVAVEGVNGYDVGTVNLTGELVRLQMKKRKVREESPDMRRILRLANDNDIQKWQESKSREREALTRSRAVARQMKLNMKICEVDLQADGRKATFYYIADERVDFRELIKIFANEFRVKVEMRQIGARQESAKVGGIGSCGRELCCSSWLTEFKSVTTTIARYQNLSINQTKLSGQCGRLKCCLNFELDTYLDALQQFPQHAEVLETATGRATLVKKDIFKGLMWYVLPDSNRHYPLTTETVASIKEMNARGERAPALVPAETAAGQREKEAAKQFVDVVGQISLRSLERNSQKRRMRDKGRPGPGGGKGGGQPSQQPQQQRPPRQDGRQDGRREGGRPPQRNENPKGGRPSRPQPPNRGNTPPGGSA
jgi:cell fate regulator YaaT (PSP1 superfamily)